MAILHHVAIAPCMQQAWQQLALSLAPGDVLVLLQAAIPHLPEIVLWRDRHATQSRWLVPDVVMPQGLKLPAGIERIDDRDWWQLIMDYPDLLEWC